MKRFLSPVGLGAAVAVLALLALLTFGLNARGPDQGIESALANGERPEAPALTLQALEGGQGALADYRGQVVVLNYWASWCTPCREEAPLLQRWHERIRPENATVLGVAVLDVRSDSLEFMRELGLTYPSLRDPDGATQGPYGVTGYPETFVIDRQGRVAAARPGPVDEAWLEETVPPLLAEKA